ncbi:unnamed protein product [Eruca vesicaria subsp. sativa]|uniref:CS domain-containing protein n=1 Tax=Eruca vesicaria subsp. sativa TaxID=29727 RepID=A0ABC8JZL0_ERUVS|nr:unnamed protein product [Eruca vesicaria subsp. sativa]
MDTISEMQEEKPSLPFNASLDPSNPLGFLENVFHFLGKESDFLLKDTSEKEIATAVTAAKKRLREAKKDEEEKEKAEKESLKPTEPPMEVEKLKGKENVILGEVPNKGNGLDLEMYSWTQTRKDVTITIPVPSGTNPRYVFCEFKLYRLKVCLNGKHTIIEGALFDAVNPRDCFWYVEDEKVITVLLTKLQKYQWWKYCVKGEPEIDTRKIDPESSKLDDLDPETRSKVEKMMLDQREKHDLAKKVKSESLSRLDMKKRRFM